MEKQSKISLNLILAGLFGWLLLANGCGKPAGSDKVATKGPALGDKAGGEPCEDCVSPGSRSALLLAAAKNQQSKAVPVNIADPIVEKAIREKLKKPTGELAVADLEKVTYLNLGANKLTDVKGLEKLTQLTNLNLMENQLTDVKGLEKLTKLESLKLDDNPDLTKAQIDELQKALPKCRIFHDATK